MKNWLVNIVRDRIKDLFKQLEKMKHGVDKEAIHRFRVEYKKLRSILRMAALAIAEPDTLKIPHCIKKIYSTSGEIRERQLWLDRIKKEKLPGYSSFALVKQVKKDMRKLEKKKDIFLSRKDFGDVAEKLIDRLPSVLSSAFFEEFIRQKRSTIETIVRNDRLSDIGIHDIRKNLKDILYGSVIATTDFKIKIPNSTWNKSDREKNERMTELLGSFHDSVTSLSFLSLSEIRKTNENEKASLLSTRQRWLAEKRKLKRSVLKELHQMEPAATTSTLNVN